MTPPPLLAVAHELHARVRTAQLMALLIVYTVIAGLVASGLAAVSCVWCFLQGVFILTNFFGAH